MMRFDKGNNSGCPCFGCEERVPEPNCHGTCERYKAWQAENERKNEVIRKDRQRYAISNTKKKWLTDKMRKKIR